ncbi:MAG: adenine phosphoribosyltransferase [Gemmatimonadaceae bacterium]|nr:adenine phosphoribosyltransferase [Gemmatimonadaceae bacterium]
MGLEARLRAAIRDVPDFPKPGVVFKDITPVLLDPVLFADVVKAMAAPWRGKGVTHVLAIESRGFLFGAPIALELGAALVPVRKAGKLPSARISERYALEYGEDVVEIHSDALDSKSLVLIVDDVVATGGTAAATRRLAMRCGAGVVGISVLISLEFLPWREAMRGVGAAVVMEY